MWLSFAFLPHKHCTELWTIVSRDGVSLWTEACLCHVLQRKYVRSSELWSCYGVLSVTKSNDSSFHYFGEVYGTLFDQQTKIRNPHPALGLFIWLPIVSVGRWWSPLLETGKKKLLKIKNNLLYMFLSIYWVYFTVGFHVAFSNVFSESLQILSPITP